jgi:hypothetical protein
MLTNVYVDAFNLYYGLGHYLSHPVRMPLAHPPSTDPHTVEVIRTEEKGSDVNLASYLLLDGFRSDCEATVVISNDSDLKVPIELARAELGLVVGVVNPHPPARRSRALQPTFWRPDAKGTIRKPRRGRRLRVKMLRGPPMASLGPAAEAARGMPTA